MATEEPIYKVPELTEDNQELLVLANYLPTKIIGPSLKPKFNAEKSELTRYLGAMTGKDNIITNMSIGDENNNSLLKAFRDEEDGFGRFKKIDPTSGSIIPPVKFKKVDFPRENLLVVYLQLTKGVDDKYSTVERSDNKEKINPINRIYIYDDKGEQVAITHDDPKKDDKSSDNIVTDQYYRIEIKNNNLIIYDPGENGINITKKITGDLYYTLSNLLKALLEVDLTYDSNKITDADTRGVSRVTGGKKSKKHRKKGGKKSQKRRSMRRLKRSRSRK